MNSFRSYEETYENPNKMDIERVTYDIQNNEVVIATLETAWREDDTALVLYDEAGRHSPCIRLCTSLLPRCEAYVDQGGQKLSGLLNAIGARALAVDSRWLQDANNPQALRPYGDN